jgi:hypothetical protein
MDTAPGVLGRSRLSDEEKSFMILAPGLSKFIQNDGSVRVEDRSLKHVNKNCKKKFFLSLSTLNLSPQVFHFKIMMSVVPNALKLYCLLRK